MCPSLVQAGITSAVADILNKTEHEPMTLSLEETPEELIPNSKYDVLVD